MTPVLGVEGGGSHCHAVLVDASGSLHGVGANDDPANWEDVGIEAAGAAIRPCVREALDPSRFVPEVLRAAGDGEAAAKSILTGAGRSLTSRWSSSA